MLTSDPSYKFNEKLQIPGVPGPDRGLPQLSFTAYSGWGGAFWGGDAGGSGLGRPRVHLSSAWAHRCITDAPQAARRPASGVL